MRLRDGKKKKKKEKEETKGSSRRRGFVVNYKIFHAFLSSLLFLLSSPPKKKKEERNNRCIRSSRNNGTKSSWKSGTMYPCLRHYHAISIIPRWTNFSSAFSFLLFLFSFFLSFFLSSFLSLHPIERKKGILRASAVVSTVLSSASPYSRHGLLTESGSRHCFNHRESPEHNSAPLYYIQPRSFIQLFLPLRRSFFFFLPPLFVVFSFFF